MKQREKAKFFDISLTTLGNWKRQGCPVNGDVAAIAEWRTARKLSQEGLDAVLPGLPGLTGEYVRRLADLDARIAAASAWPAGMKVEPGLIKSAVLVALSLERVLLQLPGRVLVQAKPSTLPEDIHRIVLTSLDEARGNDEQEGDPT